MAETSKMTLYSCIILCFYCSVVTSLPCPNVPLPDGEPIEEAIMRGIGPDVPRHCQVTSPDLIQCSLFVHSHLHPFTFINAANSIETCNIPGAWPLFQHQNMIVEVEGTTEQDAPPHTLLTKVNVTFPSSGECNKRTSSYIALNNVTLPCTFDGMTGDVHSNTNSSLQMDFSESGTVVTLRAHWINSVVIIRRIGEFLSVTMQVPGMMAFQSKGLCTATCPSHHYVDAKMYTNHEDLRLCPSLGIAYFDCFSRVGQELLEVHDITYTDACIYSMLRGASSHIGPMITAVVADAKLLPNRGRVPMPSSCSTVLPIPPTETANLMITAVTRDTASISLSSNDSVPNTMAISAIPDTITESLDTISAAQAFASSLCWLAVAMTVLMAMA